MWLPSEKIPVVLGQYLDEVILPKSASSGQRFVAAMAAGLAGQRLKDAAKSSAAVTMGLSDARGRVNIDVLHEQAMQALSKAGGKVEIPALGYMADTEDFDRLYQLARAHGEE